MQPLDTDSLIAKLKKIGQICPARREARIEGWYTADQLRQIADAIDNEHKLTETKT